SPRDVPVAAQLQRWMLFGSCLGVVWELFGSCSGGASGGAMSDDPSPTTCRFNVGNNRRVRLRIEAAAMRAGIVVLANVASCGNALAAPEYAVEGRAVGTQLNLASASYQEYKSTPSD